ncbi:MAG: hypothetical protein AAGJ35_09240, partial [Myxococcota bacterium]
NSVQINSAGKCEASTSCTYNEKTYKDGETFKSKDGCNTCGCNKGRVSCTELACVGPCGIPGGAQCSANEYCDFGPQCGPIKKGGVCNSQAHGLSNRVPTRMWMQRQDVQ